MWSLVQSAAKERDDALKTFAMYEFPDHVTGINIDDVVAVSKNDKKMDAGKVKFILLKSVGDAYIDRNISDEQMKRALEGRYKINVYNNGG